ncbi:MAG: cytidylyltransferase domain-containing protein [Acidobacteriota bacterium]
MAQAPLDRHASGLPQPSASEERKHLEVLAIIPARGGSKGIKGKNIRELHGKPLIAHTIQAALSSRLVGRVVVSTESEAIAAVARKYGAEVPFLRPAEFAGDRSLIDESVDYTVKRLREDGYHPNAVAVLYPTHPFRGSGLVDFLVEKLLEGHSPVFTCKKMAASPASHLCTRAGMQSPLFGAMPAHVSGSYVRSYGLFIGQRLDITGSRSYAHVIEDPLQLMDIDVPQDLALAEEILRTGLFRFED